LPDMVANLIAAGKPADTPAALIEWGTTPQQKTVTGPLSEIVELAAQAGIKPPAVTVIGPVVSLREKLRWFDLPLAASQAGTDLPELELLATFQ
jgi:siroheme synthase